MKIILAVVRADLVDTISTTLVDNGFHVTRLASSGGFLRRGNATLMCGVPDGELEGALATIRSICSPKPEDEEHCVTMFVLRASDFLQI
ncbi:MAG: hypothetical protein Kow00120_02610 [Anaerolineae bacterium]